MPKTSYQRWSRGHDARGQGEGHPRPRTDFPRAGPLEAKEQGHNAQVFSEKSPSRKKIANYPQNFLAFSKTKRKKKKKRSS